VRPQRRDFCADRNPLVALAVTVLLCGCGGPPASISESDAPEASETVVRIAYNRYLQSSFGDAPSPLEVIRAEVARQHPHIRVELSIVPESVRGHHDALVVWMMAREGTVDIYGLDAPWVAEFAAAAWAEPLNDLLPGLAQDFLPAGLDVFSYRGQLLGVPIWTSVGGLFCRTDLLRAAGLDVPETYDELRDAAWTVIQQQPQLTGFAWPAAKGEDLIQTWAEVFRGFGGHYFDRQGRCRVNSPAGVRALEFMTAMLQDGITPREAVSWTAEQARTKFANGQALFLRHNHDPLMWLDDPGRSQVADLWTFAPNPAQPAGQATGVSGGYALALNPYTDARDAALQVLRVIATRTVQKAFALAWGPVQHFRGLYEDPEVLAAHPRLAQLQAVLPTAFPRPQSVDYARLSDVLQNELHAALTGIRSPQAALDAAAERIDTFQAMESPATR
jgi:multiple sugar transport system substrate-binding protein